MSRILHWLKPLYNPTANAYFQKTHFSQQLHPDKDINCIKCTCTDVLIVYAVMDDMLLKKSAAHPVVAGCGIALDPVLQCWQVEHEPNKVLIFRSGSCSLLLKRQ